MNRLTLDTGSHVFFYEQDHYYLSNFSAFAVYWALRTDTSRRRRFDTSEHLYHFLKFEGNSEIQWMIYDAESAHDAFKIAEKYKDKRRKDWDDVKADVMKAILRAKADQHEYVRRKLLETGDRRLIENSWRDDVWGWGPNRDGQNLLGKLWMEVRAELRADQETKSSEGT